MLVNIEMTSSFSLSVTRIVQSRVLQHAQLTTKIIKKIKVSTADKAHNMAILYLALPTYVMYVI